jgi:hypothetical protein
VSPLKRRLLMQKWKRQRKGETGHIKPVAANSRSASARS